MASKDNTWLYLLLGVGAVGIILLLSRGGVAGRTSYNNAETWEMVRGDDGFIKNIVVHREAKEG